ncbi:MAG: hypothetical protein EKK71_14810 [Candidatus Competibacteraceae bacterium]|nr:MAG: hypothetical protein EKK71_14810 [Candidatus Competibacteraceae bacterium]
MTTLQRMTLYAFIAGIGYLVLYCFLAGEFGVWLMLFLIGAGLFNLPYELMTGRRITRQPRNDDGDFLPRDWPTLSQHTRIHDPRYADLPENNLYDLYHRDHR